MLKEEKKLKEQLGKRQRKMLGHAARVVGQIAGH